MSQTSARRHIYMHVYGGLGNQLFQAAFAIALSEFLSAEINLVLREMNADPLRDYLLHAFPALRARVVPMSDAVGAPVIDERQLPRPIPADALLRQLAELMDAQGRIYFMGFWQDEALFKAFAPQVRERLALELGPRAHALVQATRAEPGIGVHLRRLGYGHMGLVKGQYYLDAIAAIRAQAGPLPVYCFNDDPSFCKYLFRNTTDVRMVGDGDTNRPLQDFALLSACRHHVIANSTYSWWAAWLAEQPGQIVHAPSPWIFPDPLTDPVPARWIRTADALLAP